jgi:hypothetical protein
MQLFTMASHVMDVVSFPSKELGINAVYALIMTSAANVNLIMFMITPCLRLEEMNKHPNLFSALMNRHKTP